MHSPSTHRSTFQISLLWLAAVASAVSGALLFAIEMGISKQLLPLMGGTPATWNACLFFFQGMVLLASLFVLVMARLDFARQLIVQAVLYLAAILSLPLWIPESIASTATPGALSAVLSLTITSAFVILALCTTSPLLQHWIHANSLESKPYALFAASNLGSLAGLLAFPFVLEPNFGLRVQSSAWSVVFAAIAALVIILGIVQIKGARSVAKSAPSPVIPSAMISWGNRKQWMILAFIPASLLAGTNTFLTTDIAPAPLLWVFPLAAYLLSFVIAFWPSEERKPTGAAGQLGAIVVWLLFIFLQPQVPAWLKLALPVAVLFFSTLVCNTRLYQLRPHPAWLKEFYVFIAIGGLAGTAFNVFLAPAIFAYRAEYPLAILTACLFRPSSPPQLAARERSKRELGIIAALFAGLLIAVRVPELPQLIGASVGSIFIALAIAATAYRFRDSAAGLVVVICVVLAAAAAAPSRDGRVIFRKRDFYGDVQVRLTADGKFISLWHGTTIHGAQARQTRPEPLLYYSREGPLGQIFRSRDNVNATDRIAVIGLGTGASSAYALPAQRWTYYELDPSIAELSAKGHTFRYLHDWDPRARIVVGDARLQLRSAPDSSYDLIVLDAFDSDAIPVHLLTLEAFRLYLRKLRPGGLIALHISNRYLALDNVTNAAARALGASARIQWWHPSNAQITNEFVVPSQWVVVARSERDLGSLAAAPQWRRLAGKSMNAWTDDFSDIAAVFKWRVLTSD